MKLIFLFLLLALFTQSFGKKLKSLGPNYFISWSVDDDTVYIELRVKTTGWVGFGLAEQSSGSMPGSDVVIAWVDEDGEGHVQDRHAVAYEMPLLDENCQDWVLRDFSEEDGWTRVSLMRNKVTMDGQDRPFISGPMKVVWAHGESDEFAYHGVNRKATYMTFWEPEEQELTLQYVISTDSSLEYFDILTDNFELPAKTTYYHDVSVNISEYVADGDIHIIGIRPQFSPQTQARIHHFLLLSIIDGVQGVLLGWAPGVSDYVLPENVGFLAGNSPGAITQLVLQIHYDNPDRISGLVDNSGVRVYYTRRIRPFNAGTIMIGDFVVTQPNYIQQGIGYERYEYNCPAQCTSGLPHELTMIFELLHMHQDGVSIVSTIERDGITEITNEIQFYDFNFQQAKRIRGKTIQPGDRLNVVCTFERRPTQDVKFGEASDEEMCIEYITYYPRVDFFACGYVNTGVDFILCPNNVIEEDTYKRYNMTDLDRAFGKSNTTVCADLPTETSPALPQALLLLALLSLTLL